MKKTILLTLFALSALVFAQESGPPQFTTLTRLFNRQTTAAAARSAIGAGTGGVGSESINFDSTQFTVGAVTNVTIVSGVITTNAVMKGSTSGTITVGATGGIVSSGNTNGFMAASPLTVMHVGSTSTSSPRGVLSDQWSGDTNGANINLYKSRGTEASKTIVTTGDNAGRIRAWGYDGANYIETASMDFKTTGTVASTRMPGQIVWATATDASPSVLTDRMSIGPIGQIGISDGVSTAANLGLYFLNDTDTGLYRPGANELSFVVAGVERLNVISQGLKLSTSGTAATPNISLNGDSNTGVYWESADSLGISTGGTARIQLTSGQAIGMHTTVPGSFGLAINHATGQALDLIYNDSDGSPANHASLTVSSGGNLTIAPSGGAISNSGTTASTSTITGSLINAGGFGNAGGAYIGGTLNVSSASPLIQLNRTLATASPQIVFQNSGSTIGVCAVVGSANDIVSGSIQNDMVLRTTSGNTFLITTDGGNTSALAVTQALTTVAGSIKFGGYLAGTVQSLTGAGAVNVTTAITEVTTTGVSQALTLANGVAGQEKTIIHGVDGGSFVLTPTTKTGWSTFTSTAAGESITLVFLTTRGWIVKGSYLGVIAP